MKIFINYILLFGSIICVSQTPGSLDLSYGNNGYVDHDFGNSFFNSEFALEQTDGKILIGSNVVILNDSYFIIRRFLDNGAIDSTYGNNGKLIFNNSFICYSTLKMVLQPDNKLLMSSFCYSGCSILRINTNGTIDTTFGTNGFYTNPDLSFGFIKDFAVLNNGKILVSYKGSSDDVGLLLRLSNNGIIDNTFGTNGMIYRPVPSSQYISNLTPQQDDKFVAIFSENLNFFIRRYNNDGTLDTTYINNNFNLNTDTEPTMIMQQDGKCIVKDFALYNSNFYKMHRFNTDGSFDNTFGGNGRVIVNYPLGGSYTTGDKILVQTDNKIIANGFKYSNTTGYPEQGTISRFNANGSIDNSFGNNGTVYVRTTNQFYNSLGAFLILNSGKILHISEFKFGTTNPARPNDFFLGFERYYSGLNLSNQEFWESKNVGIFPNPTQNTLIITTQQTINEIKIYNTLGQLVQTTTGTSKTLDVSNLQSGNYFMKIVHDGGISSKRFIKE